MSQREVHFEVFKRQGARGGWKLHDVISHRDAALTLAQELMTEGGATGVKVIKETYDSETGDYLTLKIFEDGHNQSKVEPAAEDVPSTLPCFKPDDLYSYHARATMARLLTDYLARQKMTVTELIHRADALEKFEATGTIYQHAIQKIAVAQASSTKKPVQQIIKDLNELVTKAINRVYRDERKNYFPDVAPGQFRALADKLADDSDGSYVLNGAIAKYLAQATGWNDKLVRLLGILEQGKDGSPGAALVLSATDGIAAEILNGSAALHDLIGTHDNLGDALTTLIHLLLGQKRPEKYATNGVAVLTRHFAADDLPAARTAIANRIMAELKSMKKLSGDSMLEEIAMLRRIANKLVLGQGKYLSHEDLIAAFTLRSKRLVTYEVLARFLEPIAAPDEKIEKLLTIEESIIGAENKRQLADVMLPLITAAGFTNHFQNPSTPVLTRLQRLAELQTRTMRSGLQEDRRREIAKAIDKVASEIEGRARILEAVATKNTSHVDKVVTMLKLCISGVLTEGQLAGKARGMIVAHLAKPGFLSDYVLYVAQGDEAPEPDAARAELLETLQKAGIPADALPEALAA